MIDTIASAPGKPVGRTLATLAAATAIALVSSHPVVAQQPAPQQQQQRPAQRPAQPAQRPAAQQPPAQPQQQQQQAQQQQQQQDLQLLYSPWMKICGPQQQDANKKACATVKDGRMESGMMLVSAALVEQDGEARKLLRISLPYGVNLTFGTRLIIDKNDPATAPYLTCVPPVAAPAGCIADYEINADIINKMKKGQTLTVQAIHMSGSAMNLPLPLGDFAKAYDGPPTDPKVFEEQQKKLQEELQKRAEEARKKLEAQGGAAAAPKQ